MGRLPEEWQAALSALGERPFRAKQLFRWLHQRAEFDPEKMSDLSVPFRARLREAGVAAPFRVETVHESKDGTRKLVLVAKDGARVESVIIPMTDLSDADAGAAPSDDEDDERDEPPTAKSRVTLCISTQFGCAMGCVFCASGQAGLVRGLRASEIVSQVYLAKRYLRPDEQLSNLVYMGMGEPLHHYEQTARSVRLLTHPDGLGMSPRRITVSTVGLTPGIERLGRDFAGKIGLAVSVHAPNDETRDHIIPMNRRYPVAELMRALRAYPLPKRRRITIEYTLIDGVNDAPSHARELATLLARPSEQDQPDPDEPDHGLRAASAQVGSRAPVSGHPGQRGLQLLRAHAPRGRGVRRLRSAGDGRRPGAQKARARRTARSSQEGRDVQQSCWSPIAAKSLVAFSAPVSGSASRPWPCSRTRTCSRRTSPRRTKRFASGRPR